MNKVLHAYRRSLITIAVIGAFSAPFFVFADHSVAHTIQQLQSQIQQLTQKIQALQAASAVNSSAASVGNAIGIDTAVSITPTVVPSVEPVPPVFDDDTSDDDIIQLNNLRIQSISSTRLPAVISASYDFGITCQKFETEGAGKGVEIPCPAAPSFLYQIRVDSDTILLLRNRGRAKLTDFEVGDRINVYGFRDRDTGAIDALIIRNLDKPVVKQFIQLNNVEVVSGPSSSRPPATLVVQHKIVSPCWDFGAGQETRSSSVIPCPLGVRIMEKTPAVSGVAPIETPPAYYPRQYVIEVTSKTEILDINRNRIALDKIQIGDTLNIYGSYTGDSAQIAAQTIRDLSQSRNNRGALQVTVSGVDIYCILQQTRDERAKSSIYPITTPCGVLYDATVEVYGERGLVDKKTTARGVATFENLQFGNYTVVASAPGYERAKEAVSIGIGKSPVVSITMMLQKIVPPDSKNRPPQIIGVPAIPVSIEPGQVVSFSWSAADPDGDNLSWSGSVEKGGGVGEGWVGVCPSSSPNTTFTTSQSWASAGVYLVIVTVSDCKGESDTNEFKVQVGGISTNRPPVISGVKGPTSLRVGETGTWSVSAYDPESGSLSYSVIWGDETPVVGGGGGSGAPTQLKTEISQTATFSHSYASAGLYTPTFTVTDNGNLSEKTSMSVNVGGVTPAPSIQVLSPNGGEIWQKGTTQTIRWLSARVLPDDTTPLPGSSSSGGGVLSPSSSLSNVDIFLASWSPPCNDKKEPCPGMPSFGTFIAKGTPDDGAFQWNMGENLAGTFIPNGQYVIVVSRSDGTAKDQSDAPFSIVTTQSSYPGFFMKLDKSTYSPTDVLVLTSSRADGKTDYYQVDIYAVRSKDNVRTLIQASASIALNTKTFVYLDRWGIFKEGGAGEYLILFCDASKECVGGVNTNSVPFNIGSSSSRSIAVISPNGGEKFTYGQSLNGKWRVDFTTNKSGSFTTFLIDESKGFRLQLGKSTHAFISSSGLTYDISPYSLTSSIPSGGNYKFLVLYASDDGLDKTEDSSDAPFSIVSSPAGLGAADSRELASVLEAMRAALEQISAAIKNLR